METQPNIVYRLRQVTQRREAGGAAFNLSISDVEIRSGEMIVFLGESGCGKSTLLDLLGLVARPASASAFEITIPSHAPFNLINASESHLAELRRIHLGYVLQRGGLLPFLNTSENVALSCRLNGIRHADAHVEAILDALHIGEHRLKKPALLSGGQRQRVAIARALAHQPAILLADEPTGAVDKHTAREILALLRWAAHSLGTTVLIVTHDEQLVAHVTDRVFTFDVQRTSENEVHSILWETNWQSRNKTPA